jgi:hypothetical protein
VQRQIAEFGWVAEDYCGSSETSWIGAKDNNYQLMICASAHEWMHKCSSQFLSLLPYLSLFNGPKGGVHGYARVLEAPERYRKIVGHEIYFIAKYDTVIPARGQKLQVLAKIEHIGQQRSKPFLIFLCKNHVFLYASDGKIEK